MNKKLCKFIILVSILNFAVCSEQFYSALANSIDAKNVKGVEQLCQEGISVNYMNRCKESPLFQAAVLPRDSHDSIFSSRQEAIIKLLLKAGADDSLNKRSFSYKGSIRDSDYSYFASYHRMHPIGWTPAELIILNCSSSMARLLSTYKPIYTTLDHNKNTFLHILSRRNYPISRVPQVKDIIQLLVKGGIDVDSCNLEGETPLVNAIMLSEPFVVEGLLKAGADINKIDYQGRTPLISAIIYENAKAVKLLLNHNANVNAADNMGITPLLYAAGKGNKEVLDNLMRSGADLFAVDKEGKGVLHYAAMYNSEDLLAYLMDRFVVENVD